MVPATDRRGRDEELKAILAHDCDEEKEHAAMSLEWLRRQDPGLTAELEDHLFSDGPIAGQEAEDGGEPLGSDGSLGIGGLSGEATL